MSDKIGAGILVFGIGMIFITVWEIIWMFFDRDTMPSQEFKLIFFTIAVILVITSTVLKIITVIKEDKYEKQMQTL